MPNPITESVRGVSGALSQGIKGIKSLPKVASDVSRQIGQAPRDVFRKTDEIQDSISQQMTELRSYAQKNAASAGNIRIKKSSEASSGWNGKTQLHDSVEFSKGMLDSVKGAAHEQIYNGPIAEEIRFWKSPFQEFQRRSQEQIDTMKALASPVETGKAVKEEMKERYVEPFQKGDMRGSGKAFGEVLILGTEAFINKKVVGPKAGFKPGGKKVGTSSKNGNGGSGTGKTPEKPGSTSGNTGGAGITGGGKRTSKSKKKKKKKGTSRVSPSRYPAVKHEVKSAGEGSTGPVKPSGIPGKRFQTKYIYKAVKVERGFGVPNMSEFFSKTPLGKMLKPNSVKTKKTYQSVPIYKMTEKMKIGDTELRRGDHFYLDKMHGDHLEVFDKKGHLKDVLDLGGNHWSKKYIDADKDSRNIQNLVKHDKVSRTLA